MLVQSHQNFKLSISEETIAVQHRAWTYAGWRHWLLQNVLYKVWSSLTSDALKCLAVFVLLCFCQMASVILFMPTVNWVESGLICLFYLDFWHDLAFSFQFCLLSHTVLAVGIWYNFGEETVPGCRQGDSLCHSLKPVLPHRVTAGSLCAHPLDAGD